MDRAALVSTLEEIKRLSRDPLAADRIGFIVDRLTRELKEEIAKLNSEDEAGDGQGLVQPPKDN